MRLSCLMSLDENSLRMSRNARFTGGYPSPWGFGSLKANSIPSLQTKCEQNNNSSTDHIKKKTQVYPSATGNEVSENDSNGLEEAYLCNMAIASLVLSWSRPKVREKRRASSLMPQKAEDERSKPGPRSDSISLNNYIKQRERSLYVTLNLYSKCTRIWIFGINTHLPAASSEWVFLHTGFYRSVLFCSWFPWWCHRSHYNTDGGGAVEFNSQMCSN